eukprot:2649834-Alexandrium_andersonii.AAC.1
MHSPEAPWTVNELLGHMLETINGSLNPKWLEYACDVSELLDPANNDVASEKRMNEYLEFFGGRDAASGTIDKVLALRTRYIIHLMGSLAELGIKLKG